MPQASVSSGTAPSEETASTQTIASGAAALIACTSATTPVEVSDWVQKSSSAPLSATAAPISAGSGISPQA